MFLAGLLGEKFIEKIYSSGCSDNCIHSRLFLACNCSIEYREDCSLNSVILHQLRKLLFVSPFHIYALNCLAALGTDKDIDLIVSLLFERDKIPREIRRDVTPYGVVKKLAQVRARLMRRHIKSHYTLLGDMQCQNLQIYALSYWPFC